MSVVDVSGSSSAILGAADAGDAGTTDDSNMTPAPAPVPPAPLPPVAASACSDMDAACVTGGIFSIGRTPAAVDAGLISASVGLTDDGFELGGTSCDPTGMACVTGGISP
jgi:hypothetical protein